MTTLSKADLEALATLILKMGGKSKPKATTKAAKKAKKPAVSAPKSAKGDRKAEFEAASIEAAKKAGYSNNIPHETMLTYAKWEAKGFRPKKGQKAFRVKLPGLKGQGLPLFHRDQVEAIAA